VKILWVKTGGLVPLDTGGKIRSYHILAELSRRHEITFFTSYLEHSNDVHGQLSNMFSRVICHSLSHRSPNTVGAIFHYCRHLFSAQPYQFVRYCPPHVAHSLRQLVESERFDVVVCDFLVAAGLIPWHIACPKVLFTHNIEALIWKRRFQITRNLVWKTIAWREYRAIARAERYYSNLADCVLTVSDLDRDFFIRMNTIAKVTAIPTGVDVDFFCPSVQEPDFNTLVFTGSMDWMPNEDGILYFMEEIAPLIRREIPDVIVLVVGRCPSVRLRQKARAIHGVQITGTVDDIRPYVHRGAVYIVPLRVGGGTRLKIFEAMAMGKAVVSTPIGAEGLPVTSGENIIIADSPAKFATAVIELLQNQSRRSEIGRAARDLVERRHSWGTVAESFELALDNLVKHDAGHSVEGSD
jgi:glycosyltransferase involved in cell wall biosynthesis